MVSVRDWEKPCLNQKRIGKAMCVTAKELCLFFNKKGFGISNPFFIFAVTKTNNYERNVNYPQ
jgi:hypothetical protein